MHNRVRPRHHRLDYRVFWLLLDLDEIDELDVRLRLFSHNRFNVFSFNDRDHGAGCAETLRAEVRNQLAVADIDLEGGPIRLLCMPRVFGYVFNPISVYFCYRRSGELACTLYEVSNTFGERHCYLIPVDSDPNRESGSSRQTVRKELYVSPFIDMDLTYRFCVLAPGENVALTVRGADANGPLITTSMVGRRSELTDRALFRTALTHPLLTLKVTAAIHWEALKLWLKGVGMTKRPPAPDRKVTVVSTKSP
jgi:DUF1365 family protein